MPGITVLSLTVFKLLKSHSLLRESDYLNYGGQIAKWRSADEQCSYHGEEFPSQAEFDHEPEQEAAAEELNYWEEAADPDIGAVLDLWVEGRESTRM